MPPDDHAYYARRAQEERERADTASDASIAAVHRWMAVEYERRLVQLQHPEEQTDA